MRGTGHTGTGEKKSTRRVMSEIGNFNAGIFRVAGAVRSLAVPPALRAKSITQIDHLSALSDSVFGAWR